MNKALLSLLLTGFFVWCAHGNESPFAVRVIDSFTMETDETYNDPSAILGAPTTETFTCEPEWGTVVHPASPAWGANTLFSLKSDSTNDIPAFVTVAFDHEVEDDPLNPFGVDLIVFGNAFANYTSNGYVTNTTDPQAIRFTGEDVSENALVEVSQDGETWYAFSSGPFADGAFPTLGYRYQPEQPNTTLFDGNRFWGAPTDPTRPVDPSRSFMDFEGHTLAEICHFYNGSAGGTGYDLSTLDLPCNAKGRKWIRYVRISCGDSDVPNTEGDYVTEPDIDAISDVAPLTPYAKWLERFQTDWTTAWQLDQTPFTLSQITLSNEGVTLAFHTPVARAFMEGLSVQGASSLTGPWHALQPSFDTSLTNRYHRARLTPSQTGDARFFRLALTTDTP